MAYHTLIFLNPFPMGRKCRRYAAQKACPGIIYSVYIVYIYYNYNPSYYYIVNLVIIYIYIYPIVGSLGL